MKPSFAQRAAAAVGLAGLGLVVALIALVVLFALVLAGVVPLDVRGGARDGSFGRIPSPGMTHHAGSDAPVEIRPAGLPPGLASEMVFALEGWLLEIVLAAGAAAPDPESLVLELATERRSVSWPAAALRPTARGLATAIDAAPWTLEPGSLRIRVRSADTGAGAGADRDEHSPPTIWAETRIELRARSGAAPIGRDQVLHFDFEVDRATLFRSFREATGMSVKHWIDAQRFRRAQDLLQVSDAPVREVARLCGFRDPLYFSRAFRQRVGVAPSVWRDTRRTGRIVERM